MSTKGIITLGVVTLVVVVLALLSVRGDRVGAGSTNEDERLVPGLWERVNDVALLEIAGGGGSARLEQKADGTGEWVLSDKGGYPARLDVIRPLVLDLAQADIEGRMTSKPDQYSKLGVADPGAEGSSSRRVTLSTASGEVLADVIIGDAEGADACYVRPVGEAQALKISKALRAQSAATNWIDRKVIELGRERIERCVVTHPDGEVVEVTAADDSGSQWTVLGVPEGRELSAPSAGNGIATALSYVGLDDVAPAGEVELSEAAVAEFRCRDGLTLTVSVAEVDGTWWTFYSASFEEPSTEEVVGPSPEQVAADPEETSSEAVRAEVDELNVRLAPWAFAVSSWKAESLTKRMEDLLKAPEPEPEPEAQPVPSPDEPR